MFFFAYIKNISMDVNIGLLLHRVDVVVIALSCRLSPCIEELRRKVVVQGFG